MGASVALAGLLLVFSGFLFSQADSFPVETDDAITGTYKTAARFGLLPFVACLALAGMATAWLVSPSAGLLRYTLGGFFALLVVTGIYGAWVFLRQLS